MDGKIGTQPQGLKVSIKTSSQRQTPDTSVGKVFESGLTKAGNAVMTGTALAAPFIPGGAVLSAAITGVGAVKSTVQGSGSTVTSGSTLGHSVGYQPGNTGVTNPSGTVATATPNSGNAMGSGDGNVDAVMQQTRELQELNQTFNLQYLNLQQNMQSENRQFTTLSNVMKTKHDTAKNAINNVR
ncbi:MAG: hypothetical protein AAFX94_01660 [Myxococcota bacterium]